jgi:putative MATE family efflux protein
LLTLNKAATPSASTDSATTFTIAWPLMVELFLSLAVGLIGTILAARISDEAGGAFALGNQVLATLFILFRVVGAGVGVVVTQNLGGGRPDRADSVSRAVLGASSWLGALAGAIALGCAGPIMRAMQAPAEVATLAVPFLQALAPAIWLDAWNASMASVMRAHMRTRDTLLVLLAMHASHLALALPLMVGWEALPPMGLPGYAIALGASRAIGLGLHLWLWRRQLKLQPRRSDWWCIRRHELGEVVRIGLPGAIEAILHRGCFMITVALAAQLGVTALATHTYVFQIQGLIVMYGLATSLAVEILVGHLAGAGQMKAAYRVVRLTLWRAMAAAVCLSLIAALSAPWTLSLFTHDAAIIALGTKLLWLSLLVETGRTLNLVYINGLRAVGDVRYAMFAGAVSMPVLMAGGAWLVLNQTELGLAGIWLAYAADEWMRGLLMWHRWSTHGWLSHARAVRRRMRWERFE